MGSAFSLASAIAICAVLGSAACAEDVAQPSIGAEYFSVTDVNDEARKINRLPASGVYLHTVEPYSSFSVGGATAGDIVFAANDKPVKTKEDLDTLLESVKVGEKLRLKVHRTTASKTWRQAGVTVAFISTADAVAAAVVEERDEVKGVRYITHKDAPKFINERSGVQLHIIEPDDGEPRVYLRLTNVNRDAFFASDFVVRAGGKSFPIETTGTVHRDFSGTRCWSWYDHQLDSAEKLKLAAMIALSDDGAVVRFEGTDYFKDYSITPEERGAIRTMLERYKLLAVERRKSE